MKTLTFIAISLLSGLLAGAILAIVNQGVVDPFIERAIALENQHALAQGEMIDPVAVDAYRLWQKEGSIATGALLGVSYGALLGLVFAYSRKSLPGKKNFSKAIVLAGIMWVVIYFAVAIKYPANPPAVGNPDTINLRMLLYVAMLAISGVAAIGSALLYKKLESQKNTTRRIAPAIYVVVILAAVLLLPANPDPVTAPMDLVNSFRIASAFTMAMFWIILGAILGMLWDKTKPHETATAKAS
jgi:predicted cobalt transporter CbtA